MKLKKYLFALVLFSTLTSNFANASSEINIAVNGNYVLSDVPPFITNSCTYVPIRFVSEALNADKITWDSASQSVTIQSNNKTVLLFVNKNYAYINNAYIQLTNNALLVNSRTFVPIRFIAECFEAQVDWNQETCTVSINIDDNSDTVAVTRSNTSTSSGHVSASASSESSTGVKNNNTETVLYDKNTTDKSIITNAENNTNGTNKGSYADSETASSQISDKNASIIYNYEDSVYWLSRIIEAEAGGEPFSGKVAVGEVILNRVKSNEFPNTIWGVIFDNNFGIQFEPVSNGTVYNNPSDESVLAAKTAIEGSNYVGNCLYFLNPTIAQNTWISKNREYYTTISHHEFYV